MPQHTEGAPGSRLFVCGAVVGLAGVALFGLIHSLTIVPIWSRVIRGLPVTLIAGVALSWAYHAYLQTHAMRSSLTRGLRFGVLVWLAGVPAMALAFGTRLKTTPGPVHWSVDVATIVLAGVGGALLLRHLSHSRRGMIAGAIAMIALLAPNGGPMPIDVRGRAFALPAGFLIIFALGGVVLAGVYVLLVEGRATRRLPR